MENFQLKKKDYKEYNQMENFQLKKKDNKEYNQMENFHLEKKIILYIIKWKMIFLILIKLR